MLERALFALGGLAGGIVAAMAVFAATDKPGRVLQETQAQVERLTREKISLEQAVGKADADAQAERSRTAKAQSTIAALQMDAQRGERREAEAVAFAAAERMLFPKLGRFRGFVIRVVADGGMARSRSEIKKLITGRVQAIGLPLADRVDDQHGALIFMVRSAGGNYHSAMAITAVVGARSPEGNLLFLYSETAVYEIEDHDTFVKNTLFAADDLAIGLKRYWEAERAKFERGN